jgi:hypothetical protein
MGNDEFLRARTVLISLECCTCYNLHLSIDNAKILLLYIVSIPFLWLHCHQSQRILEQQIAFNSLPAICVSQGEHTCLHTSVASTFYDGLPFDHTPVLAAQLVLQGGGDELVDARSGMS